MPTTSSFSVIGFFVPANEVWQRRVVVSSQLSQQLQLVPQCSGGGWMAHTRLLGRRQSDVEKIKFTKGQPSPCTTLQEQLIGTGRAVGN